MPAPGQCWRHIVLTTRRAWMPGDPRGFRSRRHRVHSTGDYRHPPPADEHAGLRAHALRLAGGAARIVFESVEIRRRVGIEFIDYLVDTCSQQVAIIAVAPTHTHLLATTPVDLEETRRLIGEAKATASNAIREFIPGRVWADGGGFREIRNRAHQRRTFQYIARHQAEGAWVWTCRDPTPPKD
ncbi:MAG: hypothetical protein ACF8PN_05645 [Phycisphaerales bacterium]